MLFFTQFNFYRRISVASQSKSQVSNRDRRNLGAGFSRSIATQSPVSKAIDIMYNSSLWHPGGIYTGENALKMFERGEFPDLPLPKRDREAVINAVTSHLEECDDAHRPLFWIIAARNMVHFLLHFPDALHSVWEQEQLLYPLMAKYTDIFEGEAPLTQLNRAISTLMGALSELSEDTLTQIAKGAGYQNAFNHVLRKIFDTFSSDDQGNPSGLHVSHGLLKSAYIIGSKLKWGMDIDNDDVNPLGIRDFKGVTETKLTNIYDRESSTSYIPKVSSDTIDHGYINEGFLNLVSQDLAVLKYSLSQESTIDLRDMDTHTRLNITEMKCHSKETVTHELIYQESNPSLNVVKVTSRKQSTLSLTQKDVSESEQAQEEHRQYAKISSHLYSMDTSEVTTTQKNSGTEVNAENAMQASLRAGENTQERTQNTDQQAFETGTQFRVSSTDTEKNAVDLDREIRDTNSERTENKRSKEFLWDKNKSSINSVTDVQNNTTQNKTTENSKVSAGFIPALFVSGGTDKTKENTTSTSSEKQKQNSTQESNREQTSNSSGTTNESTNHRMEGTHDRAHNSRQSEASRVNDANSRSSGSHLGRREDGKDTSKETNHAQSARTGQKTNETFLEGGQASTRENTRDENQERNESRSDNRHVERRHLEKIHQAQKTVELTQEYSIDAGSTIFVFEKKETTVFQSDLLIESVQDVSNLSYDGHSLPSLELLPCPKSGGLSEMVWKKLRNEKNRTFIARRNNVESVHYTEPTEIKLMIRTSEAVKDEFQVFAKYYAYFQQFIERRFNKSLDFDQRKQVINLRWELLNHLSTKNESLTFHLLTKFNRIIDEIDKIETTREREERTRYFQKFVLTAMPSHGSGAVLSPIETGFLIGRQKLSPSDSCRHLIVLGPTGAGKTTRFFSPNLHAANDCSIIVNDIKGTLYRDTATSMREKGYKIVMINFNENVRESSDSNGYNPFDLLEASKNDQGKRYKYLEQILDALDQPSGSGGSGNDQASWAVSWAKQVIRAAIELMLLNNQRITFPEIISRISGSFVNDSPDSSDDVVFRDDIPELKAVINEIQQKDQNTKTVMSRIREMLDPLAKDPSVTRITGQQRQIDGQTVFKEIRKRKTVVYLVSDPSRMKLCAPLLGLFYSQFFSSVVADTTPRSLQVYCHLDEAGHIKIPDLATHMTTIRELKIAVAIGLQDVSQLEKLYGKNRSKEIMNGGAGSWLIFPSSGYSDGVVELVSRASGGALSPTDITNKSGLTDYTVTFMHSGCSPIKINLPPNYYQDNDHVPISVKNRLSPEYEKDLIRKAFRDYKFGQGKSKEDVRKDLVNQLKVGLDDTYDTQNDTDLFSEKANVLLRVVFGISKKMNPDVSDTRYDPFLESLYTDPSIDQLEGFFNFVHHNDYSCEEMLMLPDVKDAIAMSDLFIDFVTIKNIFNTNSHIFDKLGPCRNLASLFLDSPTHIRPHFGFSLEKWALFSSQYFEKHCLNMELNGDLDEQIQRAREKIELPKFKNIRDRFSERYMKLLTLRYPHMESLVEVVRNLDRGDNVSAEDSAKNMIRLYKSFGCKVLPQNILDRFKSHFASLKKKSRENPEDVACRWIDDVFLEQKIETIDFLESQLKKYPTVKRLEVYLDQLQRDNWCMEDMLASEELIQLIFENEVSAEMIKISVLKDMFYGDRNDASTAVKPFSLETLALWIQNELTPDYQFDPKFGFEKQEWAELMLRVFFEQKPIFIDQVLEAPLCVNASVITFLQNIIKGYLDNGQRRLQAIKIYPVTGYFLKERANHITENQVSEFLDALSRDPHVPPIHKERAKDINDLENTRPALESEAPADHHL